MAGGRTPLQTNAIIALVVLAVMFGITSATLWWIVPYLATSETLKYSATEIIVALIGLMASCIAGTVWVVKKFAESAENGKNKEE